MVSEEVTDQQILTALEERSPLTTEKLGSCFDLPHGKRNALGAKA